MDGLRGREERIGNRQFHEGGIIYRKVWMTKSF